MTGTPREQIVSAARGDQPMDLVVRNVDLVNVFTAEVYKADLGIKGDRYAAVARYEDGTVRPSTFRASARSTAPARSPCPASSTRTSTSRA